MTKTNAIKIQLRKVFPRIFRGPYTDEEIEEQRRKDLIELRKMVEDYKKANGL